MSVGGQRWLLIPAGRYGPAGQPGLGLVVVVGTSLEEVIKAQHRLELALVIGLPLLAAIVSVGGWFLAGAALKPVRDLVDPTPIIEEIWTGVSLNAFLKPSSRKSSPKRSTTKPKVIVARPVRIQARNVRSFAR